MRLRIVSGIYAVARLGPHEPMPAWPSAAFVSITRTRSELSIVCEESAVPDQVHAERGWRCLEVEGPIPFETIGIAASLTSALAAAGISVFVVSTYDTDYVLVKDAKFENACAALERAGHSVSA